MIITEGSTDVSVPFYFVDDVAGTNPGEPTTGLLFSDIETGGSASYQRQGGARVDFTLQTLASASAAHADGGFILIDDTEMAGVYRCDIPDAAVAAGVDFVIVYLRAAAANNTITRPLKIDLTTVDLRETNGRVDLGAIQGQAVTAAAGVAFSAEVGLNATAQGNLEDQYDTTGLTGETFPSTQAQVGNISTGSAAISTNATSTEATTPAVVGTPTNDYTDTAQKNGTYHSWAPAGGELEFAYNFNIGANALPSDATWVGYCQSNNDNVQVYARNWVGASWEQVETINGTVGTTEQEVPLQGLVAAHVNTGANAGDVRLRFVSTGGAIITTFATDRIYLSYTVVNQSIGYADGAVWYDDTVGNTGTVSFVDGTADNPVSSEAAVNTLLTALGLSRVRVAGGSTVTLEANTDNLTYVGVGWILALANQSVEGASFDGAHVTGTGTSATNPVHFFGCHVGAVTVGKLFAHGTGFGENSGQFTANAPGQYLLRNCFSQVPGSGTPVFAFTGLGSATGINVRGWFGGMDASLDSDCTMSHECVKGGGQTFRMSGGVLELRADCREVNIILSAGAASTTQAILFTGDVTISGTATATSTIQLDGVGLEPADTSVNTTVTNRLVNRDRLIGGDYALNTTASGNVGIDWANVENPTTALDLSQTDIQLCDTITTYTGNTPQTADHTAGIAAIPTVAEFEARTLVAAVYFDPAADVVVTDAASRTASKATGFAVAGDAMALTAAERNSTATALLDLASAVDGKTLRETLRYVAAVIAGKISGAGTGTETFVGIDGSTNRVVSTVDSSGNRTGISYDP